MERWKYIKGYEGIYEISDCGNVRSLNRLIKDRWGNSKLEKGILISPGTNRCGYRYVMLSKNGKRSIRYIHKIVSSHFLKEKDGCVTDHIDGNRLNNTVENLQYITQRENIIKGKVSMLKENKSSKYLGVTWDKSRGKWKAQKRDGKKNICLGRFSSEEDAYRAYLSA